MFSFIRSKELKEKSCKPVTVGLCALLYKDN